MKRLVVACLILCVDTGFAFESNDWQTSKLANEIVNNTNLNYIDYFYYNNEKINYPKLMNRRNYTLPEVNLAGVRVHDGVMDITDSSHMFFTFDGAVFIVDY